MADKQSYNLNTDKSVRQLDKLEQRLKRVDSLLQQSQRRGDVLGKMDISPKLALNDKLSDHLTRIENRLLGLHRKIFASTLQINNYATAEIAGVETYLRALTEKRWMIKFEAISWGNLFTGSFSEWLNGQNLMTSIAAELNKPELFQEAGKQAGDQFFQSFLEAIDPDMVADKFNNMELNANVNSSSNSESDSGSGIGDYLKGVGTDILTGTISGLLTELIAGFGGKGYKKWKSAREERKNNSSDGNNKKDKGNGNNGNKNDRASGNNKKNQSGGNGRTETKKPKPTKPQKSWFSKTATRLGEGTSNAWGQVSGWGKNLGKSITGSKIWKNVSSSTSKFFKGIPKLGTKMMDGLSDAKLKLFKGGNPFGLMMDVASIAAAEPGKDRSKAVGSSILSKIGAGLGGLGGTFFGPGIGTAAGAFIGGNIGADFGEWLGGLTHDLIYGKDSSTVSNEPNSLFIKKTPDISEYFGAGAVAQGALASLRTKPRVNPNPSIVPSNGNVLPPVIPTGPLYNPIRVPNVPFGTVPPTPMGTGATPITPTATMQAPTVVQKQILDPSIQVNLPNGAVQLTVNQPELDYDKIASIVGMRISNSVQLAWQNTRLR